MPNANDFVSLHNHSQGSLLDGLGSVDEYLARAQSLGQIGLGLTDHGKTYFIYDLIAKANAMDLRPIPGCEFYVAPENPKGALVTEPIFYGRGGREDVSGKGGYLHLTVWAYNRQGLKNLITLSTLSHQPERTYKKPKIDFDLLVEYSEGLMVATGCPSSEISTRFRLGQDQKAYDYAQRLVEVFGKDRVFVEIMEHGMRSNLERDLIGKQLTLAKKMGLELLATNDAHYTLPEDALSHAEALALQVGSSMLEKPDYEGGTRFAFDGDQYYLKSTEEMFKLFPEQDFPRAITNSRKVAEMVEPMSIDFDKSLRPTPIIPAGHTEESYLRELIKDGLKWRYGNSSREIVQEAKKRIKKELGVLKSSDFMGIFLVVNEYTAWARENHSVRDSLGNLLVSPVGPGRGCFEPGSLVRTSQGSHCKIENVKVGTKVRTHDTVYKTVEDLFEYDVEDEDMIKITLSNGKEIKSTSDHLIFHAEKGFIRADEMVPGDTLLGPKGRKDNFIGECDSCGAEYRTNKLRFDSRAVKGDYKPEGEYWCYDCVKSNLHMIPNVREGLKKASLRASDPDVRKKNSDGVKAHWIANREERLKKWHDYMLTDEYAEYRKECRKRMIKRYSDPEKLEELINQGKGAYKTGWFKSNRFGTSTYYASSYELKALNILETSSSIASFQRSKRRVKYLKPSTGEVHTYLPDFEVVFLDGTTSVIEVKALWQTSEEDTIAKLKQAEVELEAEGIGFLVWTEKELEELNDYWHNSFEVTNVEKYKYTGKVYDLQVEDVRNYTINDVTVHNSVGGSVIAFLLGISDTCPIRHDLMFERFQSEGRGAIYEIEYDDGTTEQVVASKGFSVLDENNEFVSRYTHNLEVGDTVQVDSHDDHCHA